ncbi:TonB-dependent receptor [candidate division WOR-3 bacterium]|nr:TonB-dependent receptor [candidate division WOR-3 bacterium]
MNKKSNNNPRIFILIYFFLFTFLTFGEESKITGKVVDRETKVPLFRANVYLEETILGDMTNQMGYFTIENVPTGEYTLHISMMGYEVKRIILSITTDSLIYKEISIVMKPIETEGVVITGRKPMIEVETPIALTHISLVEAKKLPAISISDIIAVQVGVIRIGEEIYVRGGRPGEVVYLLDGCMLQDPYDHSLDFLIPEYSVRELTFYRGGFGAEYGQAQSGIIDISTREALSSLDFKVMVMSNDFRGRFKSIHDFFDPEPYKEDFNRLNFKLGIPFTQPWIPGDRIGLFTAGEWRMNNGRRGGDYDSTFSIFGKITYLISKNTALRFSGIYTKENSHHYEARWKYIHTNCPYTKSEAKDYNITLDQYLGENLLLQFQVERHSLFERSNVFEDGYTDANGDGVINPNPYDSIVINPFIQDTTIYPSDIDGIDDFSDFDNDGFLEINRVPSLITWSELYGYPTHETKDSIGFYIGGYYPNAWSYRKSNYYSFKANLLSKIFKNHEIKAGFEFKPYNLSTYDVYPSEGRIYVGELELSPYQWSGYIQNNMDSKGLKIVGGLRYDYFNSNFETPWIPDSLLSSKTAHQFSPRLGLSFLISERDALHITYGHYFQLPAFEYFYNNPIFNPYIGNPALGYEHTVSYEAGIRHSVTEDIIIDATAYYKDITGLVGMAPLQASPYFYYLNKDYGWVKGIEVIIRKEPGTRFRYLSGIINFTYSNAMGMNSFIKRRYTWGGYELKFPEFPLDWDERIRVSSWIILSSPEDFRIFNIPFLNNFSFGIVTQFGTGLPYTSTTKGGRIVRINDERLPSIFQMDLRLRKYFTIKGMKFELFTDIQNLFNNHGYYKIADLTWYKAYGDPEGPFGDHTVWQRRRLIRLGFGASF